MTRCEQHRHAPCNPAAMPRFRHDRPGPTLLPPPARAEWSRPAGPVVCPDVVERHGLAERTLGDLVAPNIAGAPFANHLGAVLHRQNQACSGRPGYDFRWQITEPLPNALSMPGLGVTD